MKPKLIGTKTYIDFPIEDVLDYIDWNPFFQVLLRPSMRRPTANLSKSF